MRNLFEAAKSVLSGQLDEAAKGSMPTTEKEKSLAKLAEPKDKVTHKDVLVGRGVIAKEDFDGFEDIGLTEEEMNQIAEKYMGYEKLKGELAGRGAKNPAALAAWIGRKKYGKEKFQKAAAAGKKMQSEDVEQTDEAAKWRSSSAAQKVTSPDDYASGSSYDYHSDNPRSTGMMKAKSDTADKYSSLQTRPKAQVATQGARKGMITKQHAERLKSRIKAGMQEESELVDETIISENAFTIELPQNLQYKDYVQAVLNLEGFASLSDIPEDRMQDVLECIDVAYKENLVDIVVESLSWSQMQDKIAAHKKAGAKVMDVTQGTRQGKPYAAYTVIDKNGMKRRHIYHGSTSKIENMGQTTKPGKEDSEE